MSTNRIRNAAMAVVTLIILGFVMNSCREHSLQTAYILSIIGGGAVGVWMLFMARWCYNAGYVYITWFHSLLAVLALTLCIEQVGWWFLQFGDLNGYEDDFRNVVSPTLKVVQGSTLIAMLATQYSWYRRLSKRDSSILIKVIWVAAAFGAMGVTIVWPYIPF